MSGGGGNAGPPTISASAELLKAADLAKKSTASLGKFQVNITWGSTIKHIFSQSQVFRTLKNKLCPTN